MTKEEGAAEPPKAPAKPKASARAAMGNLATKIVVFPLAFAASVVVDRTLGAHDRGLFTFLLLVGNFVLPLMTFGFGGAVIYFISSGKREARDVSVTVLLMGAVVGTLSSTVAYLAWRLGILGETGRQLPWPPWAAMLILAPFQGIRLMGSRILFGESRFGTANWLSLGSAALTPLLLLAFVVGADMGLWGAVVATFIVAVATTVATIVTLLPARPRLRYDHGFVVESFRYGLHIWAGTIATRLNLRLDQVLLGIFAPATALGQYSVAMRISEVLWIFPDAVNPVLFTRLAASKNDEQRIELTGRIHRAGFLGMCVLALGAAVVGWFAIPILFGPEFAESSLLFELLLPGTVALYTAKVLTKFFGASGRPELSGRLGMSAGVLGLIFYVVLIPLASTHGAAIASSLSYAAMSLIALVMYRKVIAPADGQLFAIGRGDVQWVTEQITSRLKRRRAPQT